MDKNISYGDDYYRYIPATSLDSGTGTEVLPDLYCHTVQIVNISLVGHPNANQFVLVDAGMPGSADEIISVIKERFRADSRPECIILTHGHFDHVGAIIDLVEHWDIPVYAHELEMPFLTGQMSYPDPDPTVEGGMVAKMSPIFPNEPINLGNRVRTLPKNGNVPSMPGFRWIHTPGHSPGHVSFFREADRTLIAGDAFVTVKQEYLYKVITQEQEISGPPRYLTTDWNAAWNSVKNLEALRPFVAITGHGLPMEDELLTSSLSKLVKEFDRIAIPDYGKYVDGIKH
ncbi:metallo-beta-lactamase domain protein (plasmid) [Paenibacillus larvae subsp. larvae]|uniref:Metallo-beta-lactamase domain protein n=1 Tax=Paenibacillus larvae subsp. larvae TaxID=147375 RepID=A0A2L1U7R0_9BACL|nr:MBL fold metallo-hydrolase [Paenibacillus larvae]AQT86977.1 MBL fold metallo-hydrolase [Paenibacillus larvae subsp. pulvifaciens]AQZ49306.1 MBL fold metallo-hydrolase [Paenibacillus larvae subsp. pulvifaciens]AVF28960.1 metallo-beta-lactamase domain protein [Paenibacillus larvae subsp. larvae]AVF33342.1 metallo-beta-lactamase domain protein [Paenibacillus larvae subsp. larvae]MBH0341355.1 metallo-beta-lactamase family protein [Paenibacillus larvae]